MDHGIASHAALGRAKMIKAMIFDVDGVLFPAEVTEGWYDADGKPIHVKVRSYTDGQGISLLRAIGIHIAFITNEKGDHARAVSDVVAKWNALPSASKEPGDGGWLPVELFTDMGGHKKIVAAEQFLTARGFTFEECSMMGDDLVDVPLLERVLFAVAPSQAEKVVKNYCHLITNRPGGKGAIRDLANFILEQRGIDPTTLPPN